MRWKLESSWRGVVMFKSFYSNLWASFKLTFFCCSFFQADSVSLGCLPSLHTAYSSWYHVPKNSTSPTDLHIRMNYFWMWEVDGGNQKRHSHWDRVSDLLVKRLDVVGSLGDWLTGNSVLEEWLAYYTNIQIHCKLLWQHYFVRVYYFRMVSFGLLTFNWIGVFINKNIALKLWFEGER